MSSFLGIFLNGVIMNIIKTSPIFRIKIRLL